MVWLGNSSSGLIEVPSFKKGTINIGVIGREVESHELVIDCEADTLARDCALSELFSDVFKSRLSSL